MPHSGARDSKGGSHGLQYHPAFARTGIGYDSHRFVPG